jgi:thiamine biosynthesis lipoprotein
MIGQAMARRKPRAAPEDILVRRARPLMGTLVGVTVRGPDRDSLEHAIRGVFAEMERLEAILSEWRPDSAVSRVNQSAGKAPVRVPVELVEVMEMADQTSRATEGSFDSTWAALSPLWRLDAPDFCLPAADAVAAARRLVDYRDVVLDVQARTLFLKRSGMRLGLGGIAKAYIAERAADLAAASGAHHILIDAGGDVVARGRNRERPWTVGIRDPRSASRLLATLALDHEVVATSGDYEHFVDIDGHRYHHLLDPRTGWPASASRSATVVAPNGAVAEALSTALFVLGPPGLAILSGFAQTAALLVDGQGVAHLAASGKEHFRMVGENADVAGSPRPLRS